MVGDPPEATGLVLDLARLPLIERPFAAQLSLDVAYRSCPDLRVRDQVIATSTCTGISSRPSQDAIRLAARASLQSRTEASPDAMHAAAIIDLLWPDASGKSIDRSVSYLEGVRRIGVSSGQVLGDLSAAYLRRAEIRQDSRDLVAALERASQAFDHDSTDFQAGFNRALAMRRLHLHAEAALSFRRLARSGTDRGIGGLWIEEVLRLAEEDSSVAFPSRAVQLTASDSTQTAAAVRLDHARARAFGWDTALAAWGEATVAGRSESADASLERVRQVATALQVSGGDSSLVVALRAIVRARPSTRRRLASGHAAFSEGRRSYELSAYPQAIAAFDSAIVRAESSPALRVSAVLWKGIALAQSGAPAVATSHFMAVIRDGDRRGFTALAARARSSLASTLMRTGATADAFGWLAEARQRFAEIGEPENSGMADGLEAIARMTLGDHEGASTSLQRALASLAASRSSVRLHNALYLLATLALKDSMPRAAMVAQREGVRVAEALGNPLNLAEAHTAIGRIALALGDRASVEAAYRSARAEIGRADDGTLARWVSSDLQLAEAEADLERDAALTLARLDSGIALFRSVASPLRYIPALRLRAEQYRRTRDTARARVDLREIVTTVERELRTTHDGQQRASLLNSSRDASEQLMLLDLAAGDQRAALMHLERSRAGSGRWKLNVSETIVAPDSSIMLDFAVVRDTLFTWVIDRDDVVLVRRSLRNSQWRQLIRRTRQLLELRTAAGAVREDLEQLYDLIVRPIEHLLPDTGRVVTVVADGELADAPIAAFRDSRTERYFVERWGLRYARSIGDAMSARASVAAPLERALLVADPAFDRRRFPRLSRLSEARSEVREIATLYPSATILEDSLATLEAFGRDGAQAHVIHVAGHATFDAASPDRSALLLAGDPIADATALMGLDLRGVRVVVLSACESARAGEGRASGFLGLSSALRSAGAANVVGGLWRIDDDDARAFFVAFHRRYTRTRDAARALRSAQLESLGSSDAAISGPATWGGYRVLGQS